MVPRALLILIGIAAATVALAGMRGLNDILSPVLLALVLVIAVHPLRRRLHRLPGPLATTIIVVAVYGVILVLGGVLAVSTARFATLLPEYTDEASAVLSNLEQSLQKVGLGDKLSDTMSGQFDMSRLIGFLQSLASGILSLLTNLFFLLALLLFVSADSAWFPTRLAFVREGHAALVDGLASFAHGTRLYLVVSTVFGLIVAVIDTILLWALGIPAPVLWGLLAFITNYIPNIGFVIGLIPVAILALLEGGFSLMLWVILAYSVINVIIQSVIQPKVVGDTVGLSTTLSFVSLIFWTFVLGPLGAILAIPMSLLVKAVMIDSDPTLRWVAPLLGSPDTAAEAQAAEEAAEAETEPPG